MQEVKRVFVLLSGFFVVKNWPQTVHWKPRAFLPYHAHFPVTCQSTQSFPCPGSCQGPQGTFTFLCPFPPPSPSFLLPRQKKGS